MFPRIGRPAWMGVSDCLEVVVRYLLMLPRKGCYPDGTCRKGLLKDCGGGILGVYVARVTADLPKR